jgi:hypothetical protein
MNGRLQDCVDSFSSDGNRAAWLLTATPLCTSSVFFIVLCYISLFNNALSFIYHCISTLCILNIKENRISINKLFYSVKQNKLISIHTSYLEVLLTGKV